MPGPTPKTIEAVYENGVLKPLKPLDLPEHVHVQVTIGPPPPEPIARILEFLRHPIERPMEEMIRASEVDVD
ncbi:MAG: antitoxin family protein [Nitrospirae bacterium]|nr:antitoxin family protein [Nitrospirota bacterium]